MGIMFLVFFPRPYVDASSSWAFRKKWHRAIVGMSGVMVELAVASVAAVIWATTSAGPVNTIAHNIMFVASVSTILFNGNPLLRFDGYYVFSDLIEIPNLSNRAKSYLCYLVKKYIWAVKKARNPANNRGEKIWFVFYGILAGIYRVFVCVRILLFLNKRLPEQLFLLVPLFAFGAIVSWIFVPLGKFIRYLATGTELSRVRPRAIFTTLSTLVLLVSYLAVFKTTEHSRVEGIVEPVELSALYSAADGFITDFFQSGQLVSPESPPLVKAENRQLEAEKNMLEAENQSLQAKHRLAQTREPAEAQIYAEQLQALAERIERVNVELASLNLRAPATGVWVSPDVDTTKGTYLKRGQLVGYVVSLNEVLIRATADQQASAILIEQAGKDVEIRVKGRADLALNGKIEKIFPAGQQRLPSAALGYAVGGAIATLAGDQKGTTTAERFFEIQIAPDPNSSVRLLSGQRVVVRFKLHPKPLIAQWWRSVRQVFQRRFHI
jgi:putative peptide zinc metalloprotease protein